MTTVLDQKFPARVVKILAKHGMAVTWKVPVNETAHPETGTVSKTGETEHSLKVAPLEGYDTRLVDGTLVQVGDMRTYIAGAPGFVPKPNQRVAVPASGSVAAKTWVVVACKPIRSGDLIAAWEVQLR